MDSRDIAVRVSGLGKAYRLYPSPRERLKEAFHPWGKHYHHTFDALEDINLEIHRGTTAGIIGRNGSAAITTNWNGTGHYPTPDWSKSWIYRATS